MCGDDPLIGKLAAEHFAERRFTNVAWFSSKWGRVHRLRFTGFAKTWADVAPNAGTPLRFVWSEHAPMKTDTGWSEFSRWLGDCLSTARHPLLSCPREGLVSAFCPTGFASGFLRPHPRGCKFVFGCLVPPNWPIGDFHSRPCIMSCVQTKEAARAPLPGE